MLNNDKEPMLVENEDLTIYMSSWNEVLCIGLCGITYTK